MPLRGLWRTLGRNPSYWLSRLDLLSGQLCPAGMEGRKVRRHVGALYPDVRSHRYRICAMDRLWRPQSRVADHYHQCDLLLPFSFHSPAKAWKS